LLGQKRGHFSMARADFDPQTGAFGVCRGPWTQHRAGDSLAPGGIGEKMLAQALRSHEREV
jgi:hypothetical protein